MTQSGVVTKTFIFSVFHSSIRGAVNVTAHVSLAAYISAKDWK